MSIRDRIDEGHLLFEAGKLEGALISTCIAIAATSRKRYADRKTNSDREAFVQFLIDERPKYLDRCNIEISFQGEIRTLESILYKFVRCCLLHEGDLEECISFEYGDFLLDKRGTTDYYTFSSELVLRLMWVVETATENEGVFPDGGLDILPEPVGLKQFLDLEYKFDDIRHRMFCSACSIVTAAEKQGESPIHWLLIKGNQTFDGRTAGRITLKLIVTITYITNAKPGPAYKKTRSRPSSPDVGVIPPGKVTPAKVMAYDDIKQVVERLQIPMVRRVVTLERPFYATESVSQE